MTNILSPNSCQVCVIRHQSLHIEWCARYPENGRILGTILGLRIAFLTYTKNRWTKNVPTFIWRDVQCAIQISGHAKESKKCIYQIFLFPHSFHNYTYVISCNYRNINPFKNNTSNKENFTKTNSPKQSLLHQILHQDRPFQY